MKTILWIISFVGLSVTQSIAQSCNCSVTISAPTSGSLAGVIDYNASVVKPGKTLCIQAGIYRRITISNLAGKPDSVIRVINCGELSDYVIQPATE